jgi:hypothetical protein
MTCSGKKSKSRFKEIYQFISKIIRGQDTRKPIFFYIISYVTSVKK